MKWFLQGGSRFRAIYRNTAICRKTEEEVFRAIHQNCQRPNKGYKRSTCFKFSITRNLTSSEELDKTEWIDVEVIGTDLLGEDGDDSVTVKLDIPAILSYSDAFVFFANNDKEILQVNLKKKVEGKFYAVPHKLVKEMIGEETVVKENGNFNQISASFPKSWLPKNCRKVSGAVVELDGHCLNYYKMQNFKISIPDLLVVEEYKSYTSV